MRTNIYTSMMLTQNLKDMNVEYAKILTEGHIVPSKAVRRKFVYISISLSLSFSYAHYFSLSLSLSLLMIVFNHLE